MTSLQQPIVIVEDDDVCVEATDDTVGISFSGSSTDSFDSAMPEIYQDA